MATQFRTDHSSDPSIIAHRAQRSKPISGLQQVAFVASQLIFLTVALGLTLAGFTMFSIANGPEILTGGSIALIVAVGGFFSLIAIAEYINTKYLLAHRKSYEDSRGSLEVVSQELSTWLKNTYGLTLPATSLTGLAEFVLYQPLAETTLPAPLETDSGGTVEGIFAKLPDGAIELRKAKISDPNGSIYFSARGDEVGAIRGL